MFDKWVQSVLSLTGFVERSVSQAGSVSSVERRVKLFVVVFKGPTRRTRWSRCSRLTGIQRNASKQLINVHCIFITPSVIQTSVCARFQGQDGRDGYGPKGTAGVKVKRHL